MPNQDCINRKVPKLIREGYPKDQAVAIAYSMCSGKRWEDVSADEQAAWLAVDYAALRCARLDTRVKSLGNGRIGGYGLIWGDPDHKDLEGDYFTPQTDFWLDHFDNQPLIYDHALGDLSVGFPDAMPRDHQYGTIEAVRADDVGLWIEAQIDEHNEWARYVMELIDKGVLHWSSGSVPHLVKRDDDGKITSWPIVEWSTTPTPAEPRQTDVVRLKHYVTPEPDLEVAPEQGAREGRGVAAFASEQLDNEVKKHMVLDVKAVFETVVKTLVDTHWDEIQADAVKQGNVIEEALQPVADQLAEMAGVESAEALAYLVEYVASKVGGSAPEEVPAEEMMDTDDPESYLAVDMDELVETVAKKVTEKMQPTQPRKGGFLTKNVNVNLNRTPPDTLARFIKAVRDKDHAYLNRRRPQIIAGYKAMGINPDTTGGYLVPVEQSNQLIELLRSTAVVLPLCRQLPMNTDTLSVPKLTSGATVAWIGENEQITDNTPNTGQVVLVAKKMATLVKISNELMNDSDPAVDGIIREDISRAMANETDRVILLGSGIGSEPRGLLNIADVTKTALNLAPTYANILGAVSRVEQEDVATAPDWQWVFNPRDKSSLAQLDDTRGGYIWTEMGSNQALVGGYPSTLNGYRWNQTTQLDIDATDNNETEIFFGQWNDVVVGMRKTIEIAASNEAGTSFEYDQTWIRAILRMDVNIRHAESIEILTNVRSA